VTVLTWLHRKLTYANVAATLALVLASGGTAYAVNTVRSADIVDGTIQSRDIGTGGVQSADLRNATVTRLDLAVPLRDRIDAGVEVLDDLDGTPCTVGANPGTVAVLSDPGEPGVEDLRLACVQDPLTCPTPTPSGHHIESATCDVVTGEWELTCESGFADVNGDPDDGCEEEQVEEVCNGNDDDGDFAVDEDLPQIAVPNGLADCQGAAGYLVTSCDVGFEDQNGEVDDGCEAVV
jgi:hypothetical protein